MNDLTHSGHRIRPRLLLAAAILVSFGAAACENGLEPPVPASIEVVAGDGQISAAGQPVPEAPSIRVLDQRGDPLPGVGVEFEVVIGGGQAPSDPAVTDAQGYASPAFWMLGERPGPNRLSALVGSVSAMIDATATPGAPEVVSVRAGGSQSGVVGTALALAPAVRVTDRFGNAVPGVDVRFTAADGGSITEVARTDQDGVASPGLWTLGPTAGPQSLTASAGAATPAVLSAVASPGPASRLEIVAGDGQSATVGTPLPIAPAVRVTDAYGNPVAGSDVRFEVVSGDGSIDDTSGEAPGASALFAADSTGLGRVRWILGTRAIPNGLAASLPGTETNPVTFVATAEPDAPAQLVKDRGDGQTAAAGSALPVGPAVRILDRYGNGVPGVPVDFIIDIGGGSLKDPSPVSDEDGVAAAGEWVLGDAVGINRLVASAGTLGSTAFTAMATVAGGTGGPVTGSYDIDVRIIGNATAEQILAIDNAVGLWAGLIVGDLPDVPVSIGSSACGVSHPAINETVDDLLIFVVIQNIDGPGNVLGSAGPCFLRANGGLPVVGAMRLDASDIPFLAANNLLEDVLAHEIGHIVGVGTHWSDVIVGTGGPDPYFPGLAAVAQFNELFGGTYAGNPVPVENSGGSGTRDSHWRESVFGSELMTGWLDMAGNGLSAVTAGSLADIGYAVDMTAASSIRAPIGPAAPDGVASAPTPGLEIRELPLGITPIALDARGRPVRDWIRR